MIGASAISALLGGAFLGLVARMVATPIARDQDFPAAPTMVSGSFGAAMDNGVWFRLGARRLSDPGRLGTSLTPENIAARRFWVVGMVGKQVGWSHHGRVRILVVDGRDLACWVEETARCDASLLRGGEEAS